VLLNKEEDSCKTFTFTLVHFKLSKYLQDNVKSKMVLSVIKQSRRFCIHPSAF